MSDENTAPEPKKRKSITVKNLGDLPDPTDKRIDLEGDHEALEEDRSYTELQEALESNDLIGGTVRVSRRGPMESGFAFVCKMATNVFDVDSIKKMYGGGDYQAKFFRSNGQIGRTVTFSIDHRFKGILDTNALPADNGAAGVNNALVNAVVAKDRADPAQAAMMTQMMKSQQDSTNMMITMMLKSSEQQTTMMMGMMTAMAQAFGGKGNQSGGLELKDLVSIIPLLKGSESKGASITELTDALLKLKQLDGATNNAEEEPKTLTDKLLALAPHIANTVQALKGGAPATSHPTAAAALPAPAAAANPSNQQADLEIMLKSVISAARRNADVTLYRDLLLDTVTDEQLPMLEQVLTGEQWFTTLFGNLPDAEQVKPWLTNLRNDILNTLSEPEIPNGSEPTSKPDSAGVRPAENAAGTS